MLKPKNSLRKLCLRTLNTMACFAIFLACAQLSWAGSLTMTTYYPAPQGIYDRITLIPQTIDQNASCTIGTLMADSTTGSLLYCHNVSGTGTWGQLDNTWAQSSYYIYPANTTAPSSGGFPPGCTPIDFPGYSGRPICSNDPRCVPCIPDPKIGMECPDVMLPDWCFCGAEGGCEATPSYDTKFLGIGTSTPGFKLTLENDGGIAALGTYGSGGTGPSFNCADISRACPTPIFNWFPRKATFQAGTYTTNEFTDETYYDEFSVAFGAIQLTIPGVPDTATISSGNLHTINGNYATIAGGNGNTTAADYATITGGVGNLINAGADYSVVSGAYNYAYGSFNTISGGTNHSTYGTGVTVGGGENNDVSGEGSYATISGGMNNSIATPTGSDSYSVIGGGFQNSMVNDSYSVIGGGSQNSLQGSSTVNADGDTIWLGSYAYIGGGALNSNHVSDIGRYSVIGGGSGNGAGGDYAVVAGGFKQDAEGNYSTIFGGTMNKTYKVQIGQTATIPPTPIYVGNYSVIAGGNSNSIHGDNSVIAGGTDNTVDGDYSLAAGRKMNVKNTAHRTFAWGYSDTTVNIFSSDVFVIAPGTDGAGVANPFLSIHEKNPQGTLSITRDGSIDSSDYFMISSGGVTSGDIFVVNSNGYIGIGKNNPTKPLEFGAQANGAYLTAGGVWTSTSSRKFKDNILPLDTQKAVTVLKELRPVTYNYKTDKNEHHVGFIAEEVPDMIAAQGRKSVDPMNVTAILTSVLKEQEQDLQQQDRILDQLETELQNLKAAVQKH